MHGTASNILGSKCQDLPVCDTCMLLCSSAASYISSSSSSKRASVHHSLYGHMHYMYKYSGKQQTECANAHATCWDPLCNFAGCGTCRLSCISQKSFFMLRANSSAGVLQYQADCESGAEADGDSS